MLRVAYVCGAYHGMTPLEQSQNMDKAREAAIELWRQGYVVICPHLNSAYLERYLPNVDFLGGYLQLIRRCDLVVLLPGWERSPGAGEERRLAEQMGIRVTTHADAIGRQAEGKHCPQCGFTLSP